MLVRPFYFYSSLFFVRSSRTFNLKVHRIEKYIHREIYSYRHYIIYILISKPLAPLYSVACRRRIDCNCNENKERCQFVAHFCGRKYSRRSKASLQIRFLQARQKGTFKFQPPGSKLNKLESPLQPVHDNGCLVQPSQAIGFPQSCPVIIHPSLSNFPALT